MSWGNVKGGLMAEYLIGRVRILDNENEAPSSVRHLGSSQQ
jgi:hypothetical protein